MLEWQSQSSQESVKFAKDRLQYSDGNQIVQDLASFDTRRLKYAKRALNSRTYVKRVYLIWTLVCRLNSETSLSIRVN